MNAYYWLILAVVLVAGCSSQGKVEVPKDAKPGPTSIPSVREAGAGYAPK